MVLVDRSSFVLLHPASTGLKSEVLTISDADDCTIQYARCTMHSELDEPALSRIHEFDVSRT